MFPAFLVPIDRHDAERCQHDPGDLPPIEKRNAEQLRFDAVIERHPGKGDIRNQQDEIDGMECPAPLVVHDPPLMRCAGRS